MAHSLTAEQALCVLQYRGAPERNNVTKYLAGLRQQIREPEEWLTQLQHASVLLRRL